jgi:hypothetical protein
MSGRIGPSLRLEVTMEFTNISSINFTNPADVNEWNTFFQLPANGNPFTSVQVNTNTVVLKGGSNIKIIDNIFSGIFNDVAANLVSIVDTGCLLYYGTQGDVYGTSNFFNTCNNLVTVDLALFIYEIGYLAFSSCPLLTTIRLPLCTSSAEGFVGFGCDLLQTIYFPKVAALTSFFGFGLTNPVTLTIPSALSADPGLANLPPGSTIIYA